METYNIKPNNDLEKEAHEAILLADPIEGRYVLVKFRGQTIALVPAYAGRIPGYAGILKEKFGWKIWRILQAT